MKNIIVLVAAILMVTSVAHAAKQVVYLENTSVASHEIGVNSGSYYYTLEFEIPEEVSGKEIYGAFLELRLDVAGIARGDSSQSVPVLDVYALTNTYTGRVNSEHFDRATGSIRNLAPGEDSRVVIDVTQIVKNIMSNATANHGLILGGLEENRAGTIAVKNNAFGSGKPAKLTFHYDNRVK